MLRPCKSSVRDEDTLDLDSELAALREEIKGKAEEHDGKAHDAQAAQAEGDMERWLKGQGFPMLETVD